MQTEVSATRNAFNRFRSTLLDSNSSQHQEFVQSVMAKGGMPEDQKQAWIQQCMQALGAWKPRVRENFESSFPRKLTLVSIVTRSIISSRSFSLSNVII